MCTAVNYPCSPSSEVWYHATRPSVQTHACRCRATKLQYSRGTTVDLQLDMNTHLKKPDLSVLKRLYECTQQNAYLLKHEGYFSLPSPEYPAKIHHSWTQNCSLLRLLVILRLNRCVRHTALMQITLRASHPWSNGFRTDTEDCWHPQMHVWETSDML